MSKYTPFILGVLAGAFVAPMIGFGGFGWKLDAKALAMASDAAAAEVSRVLVPVCVAQFKADPDVSAHRAAMKGMQYFHPRMEYVEKGGWATLPGQSRPVSGLARSCTEALKETS
ncbi:MAG: hypothetical protein OEM91_06900 [Hyphomicrobiales bacterium]|nr:hypothetical protein [Hyphomicrobiales bacterium]